MLCTFMLCLLILILVHRRIAALSVILVGPSIDFSRPKLLIVEVQVLVSAVFSVLACLCAIFCIILFLRKMLLLFISLFVLAWVSWVLYCPALYCLVCSVRPTLYSS